MPASARRAPGLGLGGGQDHDLIVVAQTVADTSRRSHAARLECMTWTIACFCGLTWQGDPDDACPRCGVRIDGVPAIRTIDAWIDSALGAGGHAMAGVPPRDRRGGRWPAGGQSRSGEPVRIRNVT
jgi:hypothetical protein